MDSPPSECNLTDNNNGNDDDDGDDDDDDDDGVVLHLCRLFYLIHILIDISSIGKFSLNVIMINLLLFKMLFLLQCNSNEHRFEMGKCWPKQKPQNSTRNEKKQIRVVFYKLQVHKCRVIDGF